MTVNSSVDLNRKEDVIELGPWIEQQQQQHGRRRPALDIIISFFKCQTEEEKKRKVPALFLLPRRGGSWPNIRNPLHPRKAKKEKEEEEREFLKCFSYLARAIERFHK
jgi:hypothetical protein